MLASFYGAHSASLAPDLASKTSELIFVRSDPYMVSQHRLPECVTSDYDLCFYGHFWDELISLLDMMLTFLIASHPQTDGIAEVTNSTIE